jgi:hypothetical protein
MLLMTSADDEARISMPPDKPEQDRMAQLQTELANCVMNNSWFWCLGKLTECCMSGGHLT